MAQTEMPCAEAYIYEAFPTRTEGSVKKHWYKVMCIQHHLIPLLMTMQDMHYAEFAEDEVNQ